MKNGLLLFFLMLAGTALMAQTRVVTGFVRDSASNTPVQYATVKVKNKNTAATTGADGGFTINLPGELTTLEISYVGYATQTVNVSSDQTELQILLGRSTGSLNEVVVTALGISRSAKTLTYATQQVSGEKLNEVRDPNFLNTLSGKVAGLVVTTAAGGPGSASRIILRGNKSISGNNNALIVVDGVPYDNSVPAGQVGNDFGGWGGSDGASNINPDDIESVNVLKGPAAAALYGSRAANGAMIITTKRGKSGRLNTYFNSGVQLENPFLLPKYQNTYSQGNGGVFAPTAAASWGEEMTGQTVTDWKGASVALRAAPDNVKDFYNTGTTLTNSVGVTGGSDKVQTYLSYANTTITGIIPNNKLFRNTLNARISSNVTSKLSVEGKITYVDQTIENRPKSGEEGAQVMNLNIVPRNISNEDMKENYQTLVDGQPVPQYWTSSSIYMNPYWTANRTSHNEYRDRNTVLGVAKYQFTPWLSLQGRYSIDKYNDKVDDKFYNGTLLWANTGGSYSVGYFNVSERNMDVLLSGKNDIAKNFSVTYNIGASDRHQKQINNKLNAKGLQIPNKFEMNFATTLTADVPGDYERVIRSTYATAQLNYKDYLILDVTGRNDWSSTLPLNDNSFFYPSAGITGVISDMTTMPSWISFAKVRAAYAQVGNDIDPYRTRNDYYNFTNGQLSLSTVLYPNNLKPEITNSIETGAEVRFFNRRLGVDFTWYKTNSKNQSLLLNFAAPSGYTGQYINAGNVQNTGQEVVITGTPVKSKNFSWDITLNFARNINKIKSLAEGIDQAFLGGGFTRTATPVAKVGGSFGDLYGNVWSKDANGNHLVDTSGIPIVTSDNSGYLGNFNPKFTMGLTNSFSIGKFSLSVLVDGRFGGVMTSGTDANLAFYGLADYTSANRDGGWVLPAVTADGKANTKAITAEQFWTKASTGRYSTAEFFTYKATNVRIREASLGYNLDFKGAFSFIKDAKISLVARNLLFLYRGKSILDIPGIGKRTMNFDPDVNLAASNFQGVEYGNLPSTRSIGLNLKFSL